MLGQRLILRTTTLHVCQWSSCMGPGALSQATVGVAHNLIPHRRPFAEPKYFLSPAIMLRSSSTHSTSPKRPTTTARPSGTPSAVDVNHQHLSPSRQPSPRSDAHSHSHSHSHNNEPHSHALETIELLRNPGDRGSRITLIGLFVNIILTGAKGTAGWHMHSASLLADAGHSLSDLLGDFVTLLCWKLSRSPPSERYPYGFAKYETLGTTTVSLLLIGGALGIGVHSSTLLINALAQHGFHLPFSFLSPVHIDGHHTALLDPHAAWFAAVSVITKEWLYRATRRVADAEGSPVLLANAIHHRSDAYSSAVALFAILGSTVFPSLPLDPLGGLVVSAVILSQGLGLFRSAFGDLMDASVPQKTRLALLQALEPLQSETTPLPSNTHVSSHPIIGIRELRAKRAGSLVSVDLTVDVSGALDVIALSELDERITRVLRDARKEVSEVRIKFRPVRNH